VAGCVEALELDRTPDPDHIAAPQAPVDAADTRRGARVRQHPRAGRIPESRVAAGVILVLVSVEDLGDLPAVALRRIETQPPLERIDGERLAALGAGDEIVEVA
jgi:hypothetical protein